MTTVPATPADAAPDTSPLAHLFAAWRSVRRRELAVFALAGALIGLIDLGSLLEVGLEETLLPVLTRMVMPVVATLLLLAVWLPADRSSPTHPRRTLWLVLAALAGALLSNVALTPLVHLLPWPTVGEIMRMKKGLPPVDDMSPTTLLGGILGDFMPMAMMLAVLEQLGRRRRAEESVQRMLQEHGRLRRQAMASRLAALQAQVEPQLLFDALVDIEQAYARSDEAAPARMEQLIRHLRVALPRLREPGTRLDAEAELLESYLAVLQGLGHPPLDFRVELPEALRGASVPPMILLPLLQRALKLAVTAPTRCTLSASDNLRVTLSFDRPGLGKLGESDAEMDALAERLRVLSSGAARLRCEATPEGGTRFILELS